MVQRRFLVDGSPLTPEQAADWIAANGMAGNLVASAEEGTIERACSFSALCLKESDEAKDWILPVWDALEHMLKGNTNFLDQPPGCDIHVPKLYGKVEALVPRLMDAAIGQGGELLRCEGRDAGDRARARVIQEWLKYGLDQCGIASFGEDLVRSAVIYGLFAVHTWWDIHHVRRMVRKHRQLQEKGKLVVEIEASKQDVLAYEGMRFRVIHPRNLIADARETRVDRMGFCGEVLTRVPIVDLLRMESQGIYHGVSAALEPNNSKARAALQSSVDLLRDRQFTLDQSRDFHRREEQPNNGAPGYVDVVSLWGQWSPEEKPTRYEDFGEWQMVFVNDRPVRIAPNPYDNQHRPYCIGRISKDPFNFYAVSPGMVGVRLNAELDQHRAFASRNHQLSQSPIVWDENGTLEMPDNLMQVLPGHVIRGQGSVGQLKFPSTMSEAIAMDELVNRDMADAMGVLDTFLGRDDSGTATESNNNLREGRNRIRRQVFAIADGFKQFAQHYLWYSQQFITTPKPFRVLGKSGSRLGFATLRPEDLGDPVDIIMVGPEQFGSYGARGTQIVTFLNQGATLLQAAIQEGVLRVGPLIRELYEGVMGQRLGDEILRDDLNPDDALPQIQENMMLAMGQEVPVHELDNDEQHIMEMDEFLSDIDQSELTEDAVRAFFLHAKEHAFAADRKKTQRAAQERAMERAQPQAASQVEAGDGKKKPGDGNRYQPTPDLRTENTAQTPSRETPGPADPARMSRPDRSSAIPQGANR